MAWADVVDRPVRGAGSAGERGDVVAGGGVDGDVGDGACEVSGGVAGAVALVPVAHVFLPVCRVCGWRVCARAGRVCGVDVRTRKGVLGGRRVVVSRPGHGWGLDAAGSVLRVWWAVGGAGGGCRGAGGR